MVALIPGMENVDMFGMVSTVIYWLKIIVYGIGVAVFMIFGYFFLIYKIKATVFPLYGSGKDGVFSVAKPKKNWFCWNKGRNAWKPLLPFFNKTEVEPFDSEFIYPTNRIYAFELNNAFIPARININKTENELRGEINPVPYYIRNWQSLTHKKHAQEYASRTWWDDNKMMVFALIFSVILLSAGLVFIYMSYKLAGSGRADIQQLVSVIKGFGNIPNSLPIDQIPK